MQLKSLAKTTDALNYYRKSNRAYEDFERIGKAYTNETLKAGFAQSTLDKAQIKDILFL